MEFIDSKTIKLDKTLNQLDKFVLDFTKILNKLNIKYVIISGYISILFGRARATEDIDIFIEHITKEKLKEFYSDLIKNNYWCLNTENIDEIYDYLKDKLAVRFAEKNKAIPNFEIKFAKSNLDFVDIIKVITKQGELIISSLEKQIAYKKYYLKSDKDLEDARHIEELFGNKLNKQKINEYKKFIENG